jgi:pimeloyl-ACP methyl ester carboxylesterase
MIPVQSAPASVHNLNAGCTGTALLPVVPLALPTLGITLATFQSGSPGGVPLVFLHGNSLSSSVFQCQLSATELQSFRLIALDLPGHGQSADAPDFYPPPQLRQVVATAIRALGCEQALVVGHSYGGHLLLDILPDLPTLRGVFVVGTPPVSVAADLAAAFRFDETGMLFYAPELTVGQAHALASACLRSEAPAAEVTVLQAALTRADGRMRTTLGASLTAGQMVDEVRIIRTTPVPLAFVIGEAEHMVDSAYFSTLTAPTRWGVPVHEVPHAGHTPFLENPAAFNALLLDFAVHTASDRRYGYGRRQA